MISQPATESPPDSLHLPPAPRARRVVVRSDDLRAAQSFADALAGEGLQVILRATGDRAPAAADAVLLHVAGRLAEQLAHLRGLRVQAPLTPVLVAVRDLRDLDQVLALEMGADDVVDSVTAAPVVAARLRALWRRGALQQGSEPPLELRFGALELLLLARQARLAGAIVPLTEGEFELLWLLASHAGQAMSRRELLRRVRGLDDDPLNRSIDSRVYRIRSKLGDHGAGGPRIRTVRNHGYAFSPVGW